MLYGVHIVKPQKLQFEYAEKKSVVKRLLHLGYINRDFKPDTLEYIITINAGVEMIMYSRYNYREDNKAYESIVGNIEPFWEVK
jgi:hypothetical protein